MPRRDRTGPLNQGEKTGRGLGDCNTDIYTYGRNFNLTRERGVNYRRVNYDSKEVLNKQKAILEEKLRKINEQLDQN